MQGQAASKQDCTTGLTPWRVKSVNVTRHLKLQVIFNDDTQGEVIIDDAWLSGVFADLRKPELFAQAYVEHGAVTWPNGLDLAPDCMYQSIKNTGQHLVCD